MLKRTVAGIPSPVVPEVPTVVVKTDEVNLDNMTKQQLLDWALEQGHDLVDNKLKAEILKECKAILAAD